ncbi:hypothetical protein JKP88DRAFT_164788 [Tribonema minus]|uniref:Nickel/cobalt efflux system n=1 Tax=Tribonema minus TaxID=303371 RepID=A0A835YVB1_9STRA|nr:hypothetical protein JKP88DRAFT_164788 [Tribonema minus]
MGGGVLAGGLHAISGPDHLAALLPRIMGKAWPVAMRIGAVWGLGHGFSATLIGLAAFFLKDRIQAGGGGGGRWISKLGTYTEVLVGVSLITIGLIGLKESLLDKPHEDDAAAAASEISGEKSPAKRGGGQRAIFLNGLLHGFSWDGAPSLAPALACTTWHGVLWFLLAYCGGTMAAMSAATTIIGEGSVRVGQALEQPDIPKRLSVVSSGIAIAIGAVWLVKAAFFGGGG